MDHENPGFGDCASEVLHGYDEHLQKKRGNERYLLNRPTSVDYSRTRAGRKFPIRQMVYLCNKTDGSVIILYPSENRGFWTIGIHEPTVQERNVYLFE
jgi:hypothetical protein